MALQGKISAYITGREYRIEWSATQSVADNKSTITCVHKLISDATYALDIGTRPVICKIGDASNETTSPAINTGGGSTITLGTTTHTVTHNSDGTKSVALESTFYIRATLSGVYRESIKASGTISLDAIPRVSVPTVSAASVQMLSTVTISTNRKSASFTHDLSYSLAVSNSLAVRDTIATGVGDSYQWTVPDLVSNIPGNSSVACTITCKTKSGSTVIGTNTVTLTLTIPAKSKPSVSASSVKMGTSVNILTNRKSKGYTHTITYAIGTATGTIGEGVEGDRTWTPPKSLAAYTGNKVSGTCTITCKTYNGSLLVGTDTTQLTLTVPDATVPKLSATSIVLGNPITITTPREADCYEHDISYTLKAYGSSTEVFSEAFDGAVQESYEWTPSLSLLAPKIPSSKKGTITVTCKTRFKGSTTVVGTAATVSFTITVPDNSTTKPKVTMTVSPVSELPSAFEGLYVAGKSSVRVSYAASSDYSTIQSYRTTVNGESGSANPYTSGSLSTSGTVTVTGEVTDAREYSTKKTVDIEVIPYSRPRIIPANGKSGIVCTRCNSDGNADPGGVRLLIQIGRKYDKVVASGTQKNFCKLSYQWKTDAAGDDAYSDPEELLSKDATSDYVSKVISGIVTSNTTAYNIRLIAEDDVGDTDTVTITVPTAFAAWHVPIGGHGFTLGGYHDPAKVDVFDCRFAAEFQGDVSGRVLGMGKLPEIPEDANFDAYKEPGVWAVKANTIAATISNIPEAKAGTLRVWSANGCGSAADTIYIMQEYICYDNSASYRRSIQLSGSDGAWEYMPWKVSTWQTI